MSVAKFLGVKTSIDAVVEEKIAWLMMHQWFMGHPLTTLNFQSKWPTHPALAELLVTQQYTDTKAAMPSANYVVCALIYYRRFALFLVGLIFGDYNCNLLRRTSQHNCEATLCDRFTTDQHSPQDAMCFDKSGFLDAQVIHYLGVGRT